MAQKRVLIFSLMYYPLVGGAEIAVKEITGRISREDIAFDMVTLRYDRDLPKMEQIGNIAVYRVGFSRRQPTSEALVSFPLYLIKVFYPLFAFIKAFALYKKNRYDALWSIMSYAGFPAIFLKWRFPRVPLILTLQEGDSITHMTKRLRIRLVDPLYRLVFQRAAVVQAISHFLADFARERGATGKIVVVPNGVSPEQFMKSHNADDLLELGKTLGAKHTTRYMVTTSRLVPKNAVDILVMALKYIPPAIELVVVGDGPDRAMLTRLAKSEGVLSRVHFVGHKPLEEVSRYLAIAEVFARPSRSEGLGSSFLEAMAAGVPIVATRVGGIADFLRHGETGLECMVNDPKDTAAKIMLLFEDSHLREHIVAQGRVLVVEAYTWDHIVEGMKHEVFGIL